MPLNRRAALDLCRQLAEHEGLKVTVKESMKSASVIGGCAFLGGLIGGPIGLAIGSLIGTAGVTAKSVGSYRSVAEVISNEMTNQQQDRLAENIQAVLADVRIEDFTMLLPFVLNNSSLQQLVMAEMLRFLREEMQLSLV